MEFDSFSRAAKVGVAEFLNGVGKRMEAHVAKVEEAVGGDLQRLLEARTLRLKNLGIPSKHVRSNLSLRDVVFCGMDFHRVITFLLDLAMKLALFNVFWGALVTLGMLR
ncbi:hypothetical protein ABZP36_025446 [Zizania latifolia]